MFNNPMAVVGDLGRAIIRAAPGNRFLAADFSGVESRGTAWLSGEQSKINAWARFDATGNPKDEPYYLLGIKLGQPEETARTIGKIADLAFGYMGGPGAYRALDHKTTLTDEEIQKLKYRWRDEHPRTVKFWKMLVTASVRAMQKPGVTIPCGRVSFTYDGAMFLRMHLPSGRDLAYPVPRLHTDLTYGEPTVIFKDNAKGKFFDCRDGRGAYGGTWIENAVQAVARDLLVEAMFRLEAAGYPVVLHVHDEIVCEVPNGTGTLEEFERLMITAPAWADGLPIAAKARNGMRFAKIKDENASLRAVEPVLKSDTNTTPEPEIIEQIGQTPPWVPDEETPMELQNGKGEPVVNAPPIVPDLGFSPTRDKPKKASETDQYSRSDWAPKGHNPVAKFTYHQADGTAYLQVWKYDWIDERGKRQKSFPQYHLENGQWVKKPPQGPRIPYRLPELLAAPADAIVDIFEGEKDADRGAALGLITTTNPGGAGKWGADLVEPLRRFSRFRLHEDNDAAGRKHVPIVAATLKDFAKEVLIIRYPELDEHGDFSDFMDREGNTIGAMAARAQLYVRPKLLLSSAEFVAGFEPPDYLIVGWLQRRFVYSFTAATGGGKTAIALQIVLLVSQGKALGGQEVKRGSVLYFAGENPDDVRMRWIATTAAIGLSPEDVDNVHFMPGTTLLSKSIEEIRTELAAHELALVVVDTSAAFFEGDDENNNTQALAHAKRMRALSELPGGPAVLVCSHPTKNAETLLPRGGGAFLNEMDGNLTGVRDDLTIQVHWQGKFRGPEFAPLDFRLEVVTHPRLHDKDNNPIRTIIAQHLDEVGLKQMKADSREDQDVVLLSIEQNSELTQRERARELNWMMKSGEPYQMRVARAETALKQANLIKQHRGRWELTEKGTREIGRLKKTA